MHKKQCFEFCCTFDSWYQIVIQLNLWTLKTSFSLSPGCDVTQTLQFGSLSGLTPVRFSWERRTGWWKRTVGRDGGYFGQLFTNQGVWLSHCSSESPEGDKELFARSSLGRLSMLDGKIQRDNYIRNSEESVSHTNWGSSFAYCNI